MQFRAWGTIHLRGRTLLHARRQQAALHSSGDRHETNAEKASQPRASGIPIPYSTSRHALLHWCLWPRHPRTGIGGTRFFSGRSSRLPSQTHHRGQLWIAQLEDNVSRLFCVCCFSSQKKNNNNKKRKKMQEASGCTRKNLIFFS